jgi:signal transduction histidine kinase/CheY-like chemotaxis protein
VEMGLVSGDDLPSLKPVPLALPGRWSFEPEALEERFLAGLWREQRFAFWFLWLFAVMGLGVYGGVVDFAHIEAGRLSPRALWFRGLGVFALIPLAVYVSLRRPEGARLRAALTSQMVIIGLIYSLLANEYIGVLEVTHRRFWYPLFGFFCCVLPVSLRGNLALVAGLLFAQGLVELSAEPHMHVLPSLLSYLMTIALGMAANQRLYGALRRRFVEAELEASKARRSAEAAQQLERELLRSQRIQLGGEIAAGVAHDFNNLMQIISAEVGLARSSSSSERDVEVCFEAIERVVQRAGELSGSLRDLGGRAECRPEAVSLNALLDRFRSTLVRALGSRVAIELDLSPQPLSVVADPGALEQAILNLSLNARDAMNGEGVLRLTTRFETDPEGARVILEVTDNGAGMSRDTQAHALDPFFSTKAQGQGSGLGLSMVQRFARLLGGELRIESEVGLGTCVSLKIPGELGSGEAGADTEPSRELIGGRETLLLVEDEPMVLEKTARFLERCGYSVLSARDGLEALTLFEVERERIELVLADVDLPAATGFELYDGLRESGSACPVLFVSALDVGRDFASLAMDPRVGLLSKPYRGLELGRALRSLLDGPRVDSRS